MLFDIEVNNQIIHARKGETILTALRRNGIKIPTLCNMENFTPTGACRMCVVEVEGENKLIPSCSCPVEEWMKIKTHSPRVLSARKTIVELLLSNHPDDCLYCERNGNCELQHLAEDLNIRERRIPGKKSNYKIDKSSSSLMRDPAKCILCGRCVRVCEEIQSLSTLDFTGRGSDMVIATAFNKPLNFSSCINCGQCVIVCPTGALTEKLQFGEIEHILHEPTKKLIAQYSPAITGSLAEEFGIKSSHDIHGIINATLRKIGFYKVFETSFGIDLNIMEMAEDFIKRFEKGEKLPLITGCCPAWIKFAEQQIPEILPYITTVKSPQQIIGSLIKSYVAKNENMSPSELYSISIMPCTAKKYEGQRVEMTHKGLPDVETVLTTREFARLIRLHGIDINQIEPEPADEPFTGKSSVGRLAGVSGGVLESLLRTVYKRMTAKELEADKLSKLRSNKPVREAKLRIDNREINVVAVSGMSAALNILNEVLAGKKEYHIIEIMACPDGCVSGGGQMIRPENNNLKAIIKGIYDYDSRENINVAHKNPGVGKIYNEFLIEPMSNKSKELLHTTFPSPEVK